MRIYKIRDKNTGLYFSGFKYENHSISNIDFSYSRSRSFRTKSKARSIITTFLNSMTEAQEVLFNRHTLEIVEFELVEIR